MSLVLNESELIYAQNTHFMDPRKFSAPFRRNGGDLLTQENFRRSRFTSSNSRHFANRSSQATFSALGKPSFGQNPSLRQKCVVIVFFEVTHV